MPLSSTAARSAARSTALAAALLACAPRSLTPAVGVDAAEAAEAATTATAVTAVGAKGERTGGLVYEVYVRSYQDSDGDGVGDLEGLRSRLDHLSQLGVETLWLMPLFPAFGPAGYDVIDYSGLRPELGRPTDLAALVEDAHALGMRVLIDLPFNHVHESHPWFVAAEAGEGAARSRFVYVDVDADEGAGPRWHTAAAGGAYYGYFGPEMPDLDWTNSALRAEMTGVLDQWLRAGADGYRLDAVLMLVEEGGTEEGSEASHTLLGELLTELRAAHPNARFLAEASEWEVERSLSWLDAEGHPGADQVLDFPRHQAAMDAIDAGDAEPLRAVIEAELAAGDAGGMVGFLGSHDLDRLPARVTHPEARRALRVASMLLPGDPALYYGEELDLGDSEAAGAPDYAMRAPMPWTAEPGVGFSEGVAWFPLDGLAEGPTVEAALADPDSTLHLLRGLSCVRRAAGLGGSGEGRLLRVDDPALLSFERPAPGGAVVVVVNLADRAVLDVVLPVAGEVLDLRTGERYASERSGAEARLSLGDLPAYGARVLWRGAAPGCSLRGEPGATSG